MQVTDVRVRMVSKDSKMKAVVSVTFDNEFVVHDIKVIEGEKGLFIAKQEVGRRGVQGHCTSYKLSYEGYDIQCDIGGLR